MTRTAILNVVGLTPRLIGEHTPNLRAFREAGWTRSIQPPFPAVTCTAQSDYLTGQTAAGHGIVANGWFDRDLAEVHFWKQSNRLVKGEKLWETLRQRHPGFTCAKLFWWYNMFSSADWSITPRPMYPADGRKVFDVHAWPYPIRTEIKQDLGEFPFPGFWGPAAGRPSPAGPPDAASRWIANSAKWIESRHSPDLSLVYLPHLDYNLQRHGPVSPANPAELNPAIHRDLREIDAIVGDLISFYQSRQVRVGILSEYGITNVSLPIHLNRILRERGWLQVKEELGLELLDAGSSRAFAVADHQIAHIYVQDAALLEAVKNAVASVPGVAEVLDARDLAARGLHHRRAGDLVAVAREDAWFTYYYWLDDALAPDFARTVDIHRKPGYDPVELFTNPALSPLAVKARIGWRLLQKKLGFRMLMDLIPLEATLVKGSHGCRPKDSADWPVLMLQQSPPPPDSKSRRNDNGCLASTDVRDALIAFSET